MCATSDELTEAVQAINEKLTEVNNLLESRQQPSDSTSTLCECKVHLLFTRESLASYSAYSL